jgi:hypothetical protein
MALKPVTAAVNDWVATDNFDSYSSGSGLTGANGGSGWNSAWAYVSGSSGWTAQSATPSPQGGNYAQFEAAAGPHKLQRGFTNASVMSGTLQWYMRCSVSTPNAFTSFIIGGDPGTAMSITFGNFDGTAPPGQLSIYDDVNGFVSFGSYVVDTWYLITLEFDCAISKYRAKVGSGTWSALQTFDVPLPGGANYVQLWGGLSVGRFLVDDIKPYSEVTTVYVPSRCIFILP